MQVVAARHSGIICSTNFLFTTSSYVYDTDVGGDMPSYKDYKYGVEYMFISLLAKSKFRTKVSCAFCVKYLEYL